MLKDTFSKIAFSLTAITLCFGTVKAEACAVAPSKTTQMIGGSVLSAAAGAIAGNAAARKGDKGAIGAVGVIGSDGVIGPTGADGAAGAAGTAGASGAAGSAGANFSYATGPAGFTFNFVENSGTDFACNLQGIIVTPSQQVYETAVLLTNSGESQAITIPAPAEIGQYMVIFYELDTGTLPASATCLVTNTLNGNSALYQSALPVSPIQSGQQSAFSFVYDTAIIH